MSRSATTEPDGGTAEDHEIVVGETADGESYSLPVEDVLTGRGFVTGKSGSGKSNTGSVIAEELLDEGHPLLCVDTDGEYWSLKEEYEILHVGASEECDLQVGPEHAGKIAELAIEQHVPIVLDVSEYLDRDEADALVRETAHELFVREKEARRPFLMLVEEFHEYVPQQGSRGEVGDMLVRIGKRGRKRGLGIIGASQRPANVDKDFITQADLVVWHRLTWENDVTVARRIVGSDPADAIADLADGEAFVQADWADADLARVQFRRKRTFDAGATPGLDDVEQPDLKSIDADLVGELEEISEEHQRRQDRVADLEARLEAKDEEIAELEQDLEQARDVSNAAQQFAQALQDGASAGEGVPEDFEAQLTEKNEEIAALREEVADLEERVDQLGEQRDGLQAEVERLRGIESRVEEAEQIEEQLATAREALGMDVEIERPEAGGGEEVEQLRERVDDLESENERLRAQTDAEASETLESYEDFLGVDVVQEQIDAAKEESSASRKYVKGVIAAIINEGGPVAYETIAERLGVSTTTDVSKAASELERRKIVAKDRRDDGMWVDLNTDGLEAVRQAASEREKTEQLMEEL